MLALAAAACFLLAAFGVDPAAVNLVWLGLAFLAADFAFPYRPGPFPRR